MSKDIELLDGATQSFSDTDEADGPSATCIADVPGRVVRFGHGYTAFGEIVRQAEDSDKASFNLVCKPTVSRTRLQRRHADEVQAAEVRTDRSARCDSGTVPGQALLCSIALEASQAATVLDADPDRILELRAEAALKKNESLKRSIANHEIRQKEEKLALITGLAEQHNRVLAKACREARERGRLDVEYEWEKKKMDLACKPTVPPTHLQRRRGDEAKAAEVRPDRGADCGEGTVPSQELLHSMGSMLTDLEASQAVTVLDELPYQIMKLRSDIARLEQENESLRCRFADLRKQDHRIMEKACQETREKGRQDIKHEWKKTIDDIKSKELEKASQSTHEQMKREETRPVSHSRLVVCGTGRAGKTCLLRTFLNILFKHTESTRGVDFSRVMCFGTRGKGSPDWTWEICENAEELDLRCEAHALAQEAGKESTHNRQTGSQAERHNRTSKTMHPEVNQYNAAITTGKEYFQKVLTWVDSVAGKDLHFLDIWDLAGQSSYIAFQQVVIKEDYRCAYPIVYNSSTILETSEELDVIEKWLDFLYDTTGNKEFFFYLVGCQIDKIFPELQGEHKRKVKQKVRNKLIHKPYIARLAEDQLFFFVDNTVSGKEGIAQDRDAVRLRCRITSDLAETCKQQFIPLRWLSLAFTIGTLVSTKPCLPLDDALLLAEEVCKTGDQEELREILRFYNQLGRLLSHDLTNVKAMVILDVHGFLKVISALFLPCDPEMDNGPWEIAVKRLHADGILLEDLAIYIWKRDCSEYEKLFNDSDKQAVIFEVMEKYALLFNTRGQMYMPESTGRSQAFLVPSLAPPSQHVETPVSIGKLLTGPSLYLKCGDAFKWHRRFTLPKFWQLVVRVLQRIRPTSSGLDVVKLTQTSAVLPSTCMPHILYLAYQKNGVWVSLHWPQHLQSHPSQVCLATSEIVMQEVCQLITDGQTSDLDCATAQDHHEPIIPCAKHKGCTAMSSHHDLLSIVHLDGVACSACKELAVEDIKSAKDFWFAAATVDGAETESHPVSTSCSPVRIDCQPYSEGRVTASDQRAERSPELDRHVAKPPTEEKHTHGVVPMTTLLDVADCIADKSQCIRLAAELDLDSTKILNFNDRTDVVKTIARDVLLQWFKEKSTQATCKVLREALMVIKRLDLVDKYLSHCPEEH